MWTWSAVVFPIFTMASVIAAVISRFCWSVRPAYHWIVMFGMASLLAGGSVSARASWPGLWQRAAAGARRRRPRARLAACHSGAGGGGFVEEDPQHPLVELLVEGRRRRIAVVERVRLEHE